MTIHTVEVDIAEAILLNANQRLHHHPKAERTATIRRLAALRAKASESKPHEPLGRAHCIVHVGWPNRRKRDVHNIYPTIKAAIDGIATDAGWLFDDNDQHLIGPDLRPYFAGKRGFVLLRFVFHAQGVAE